MTWWNKHSRDEVCGPRIGVLASLAELHCNLYLDRFSCTIVKHVPFDRLQVVKSCLEKYRDVVCSRGTFSRVAHTAERLVVQKCHQLGMDAKKAESIVRSINSFAAELNSVPLDGETKLSHNPFLMLQEINLPPLPSQPIFKFILHPIHASWLRLTYDERFTLSIDEVLLTDHCCNPLVHIFGSRKDTHRDSDVPRPREGRGKSAHFGSHKKSSMRGDATERSYPHGCNCTFQLVDSDYSWGSGGASVRTLYPLPDYSPPDVVRKGDLHCKMLNVDLVLNPHSLAEILHSCKRYSYEIAARVDVWSAIDRRRGSMTDGDLLSCHLSSRCTHVVLAVQNDEFLAEWNCRMLKVDTCAVAAEGEHVDYRRLDSCEFGNVKALRVSLDTLELYDLSVAGSLHPSALVRVGSGSGAMFSAHVYFRGHNAVDIKANVAGAQMCLLARFVEELIEFSEMARNMIRKEWTALCSPGGCRAENETPSAQDAERMEVEDYDSDDSSDSVEAIKEFARSRENGHLLRRQLRDQDEVRTFYRKGTIAAADQRKRYGRRCTAALDCLDTKENEDLRVLISVEIVNSVVTFPRNSASDDLIAVTIKRVSIVEEEVADTWKVPGPFRMRTPDDFIYFDYTLNEWRSSKDFDDGSSSGESMDTAVYSDEKVSKTDSDSEDEMAHAKACSNGSARFHNSAVLRLFGCQGSDSDSNESGLETRPNVTPIVAETKGDRDVEGNVTMNGGSSSISSSEYDFEDALEGPTEDTATEYIEMNASSLNSPLFSNKRAPVESTQADMHQRDAGNGGFTRFVVQLSGVELFSSIKAPMTSRARGVDPLQVQHRWFSEVVHGASVYSIVQESKTYTTSAQTWCRLSQVSADILVVLDFIDDTLRILVSECPIATPIHCKLTMAQYYLFMSIFLDNGCEDGAFFQMTDQDTFARDNSSLTFMQRLFLHRLPPSDQFKGVYPEYGSVDYLEYLRHLSSVVDLVVVRSDVDMECYMDSTDFACKIPTSKPCAAPQEEYPFVRVQVKWVAVNCSLGINGQQIGMGVGDVVVMDCRDPNNTRDIYKTAPSHTTWCHGYSDMNYGLKNTVSELCSGFSLDIPFKATIFAVGHAWHTINCGCSFPDVDVKDLEVIMLMIDYYSLYFRNKEFGNPAVAARARMDKASWPYNGVDLRIFVHKPHLQISENAFELKNAQCLIIEANSGAHVRFMIDSNRSMRTEVRVHDMAMVMLRTYQSPAVARGLRGTAGSGRGIRTLLEFMNIDISIALNELNGCIDVLLKISPSQRTAQIDKLVHMKKHLVKSKHVDSAAAWKATTTYVDLDSDTLFIPAVTVKAPTCIANTCIPPRTFPRACCSIVTSYEDVNFAINLVSSVCSCQWDVADFSEEDSPHTIKVIVDDNVII